MKIAWRWSIVFVVKQFQPTFTQSRKPSFTDAVYSSRRTRKMTNSWPATFNLFSQSSSVIQGADLIVLGKTPWAYFIVSVHIVQNQAKSSECKHDRLWTLNAPIPFYFSGLATCKSGVYLNVMNLVIEVLITTSHRITLLNILSSDWSRNNR